MFPVFDLDGTTDLDLYNNDGSCVHSVHTMTSKAICHMELRENSVREWVVDKLLAIKHVAGKCNPSNIFTKEMKDVGLIADASGIHLCVDRLTFFGMD